MQTSDVLIAPGLPSHSVSCSSPLLLSLLSLLLPCGEGPLRKTGKERPAPPAHPPCQGSPGEQGGGWHGPRSGLAICREQVEGTRLPSGSGGLSAEMPGGTGEAWLGGGQGSGWAGVLLENSTVRGESRGLEVGLRPNFWSQLCR